MPIWRGLWVPFMRPHQAGPTDTLVENFIVAAFMPA